MKRDLSYWLTILTTSLLITCMAWAQTRYHPLVVTLVLSVIFGAILGLFEVFNGPKPPGPLAPA